MINTTSGIPCVDPTAALSEKHRQAASVAGHGIPFLTDEAKYAMILAQQKAKADDLAPKVK